MVTIAEELLADLCTWYEAAEVCEWERDSHERQRETCKQEQAAHEQEKGWEEGAYCAQLLELKDRHITLLNRMVTIQEQQASMAAPAVGAAEEDYQVLDSILALTTSFMLPTASPSPSCRLAATRCPATSPRPSLRAVGMGGGPAAAGPEPGPLASRPPVKARALSPSPPVLCLPCSP